MITRDHKLENKIQYMQSQIDYLSNCDIRQHLKSVENVLVDVAQSEYNEAIDCVNELVCYEPYNLLNNIMSNHIQPPVESLHIGSSTASTRETKSPKPAFTFSATEEVYGQLENARM